jgi:predicted negative regulator of RcsB-dependent stress response
MNSEPIEGAGMIEAMTWLEVNKKRLAVIAVAILALGFAVYVWSHMREQKEVTASSALLQLRPVGNSPTNMIPVPSADFLKVAQAHQGTAAAERAKLLAAGALFGEAKYSEAYTQFDNFIRDYPASPWAAEAAIGIAASQEAQGKNDEAITAYQRVVTSYGSSSVANQARMSMARIYEAKNQPESALKQYDDISKQAGSMGMTMAGQEAFMKRQELLRKFPHLAPQPTNALTAMAPMVSTNLVASTNVAPKAATTNTPAPTNATPSQKK